MSQLLSSCCPVQEFLASTVNLALLEREEVCLKAFAKLDKVGRI